MNDDGPVWDGLVAELGDPTELSAFIRAEIETLVRPVILLPAVFPIAIEERRTIIMDAV